MSGSAGIIQAATQLRRTFPAQVTADTLKKLGIAPTNESYVINILRFIGVLDADGNKTAKATEVFTRHEDSDFQKGFADLVQAAYKGLFDIHGKDAWSLTSNKLIAYFRGTDHTSSIVGQRQATTFQALAALSGFSEVPTSKSRSTSKRTAATKSDRDRPAKTTKPAGSSAHVHSSGAENNRLRDMALTVRIEVNLPASADQETYDRIFKSMRENLLDG